MLLGKVPLLRVFIPFVAGIIWYRYFPVSDVFSFPVSIIVFTVLIILNEYFLSKKYVYQPIQGILLYAAFFVLGIFVSSRSIETFDYSEKQNYLLKGEIVEIPKIMDKTVKLTIRIEAVKREGVWQYAGSRIIVYLPKDSLSQTLQVGDLLALNPKLNIPQSPKNPHQFNYRQYLQYHLIAGQAFLQSTQWIKLPSDVSTFSIYIVAQKVRAELLDVLRQVALSKDEQAIAQALILGYKNEMQDNVQQAYAAAGATHVLAVSGLHVGIVYLILQWIFGMFKTGSRWIRGAKTLLTLLLIWGYAFVTGLSVSVMRAALMFSFMLFGQLFDRKAHILNSLAASALLLLSINPNFLFQLGFQLSYLAVAGIVIFQPFIAEVWQPSFRLLQWVRDLLSVSVAAQVVTLPLTLLYFHQFPVYFFITNLVVIPAAFLILLTGLATLLSYFIHPFLFHYLGEGLHWLINITNRIIFFIQQLPYATVKQVYFTESMTVLAYVSMVLLIIGVAVRKYWSIVLALSGVLAILVLSVWHDIEVRQQKQFIVYAVPPYSVYNFIDASDNILITDNRFYNRSKNVDFTLKNNWIALGVEKEKVVPFEKLNTRYLLSNIFRISNVNVYVNGKFFYFYGKRIAVIDNEIQLPDSTNRPLMVDYLILAKNTPVSLSKIMRLFIPKMVIIDSSNGKYKIEQWEKFLQQQKIPYYNVPKKGAFSVQL